MKYPITIKMISVTFLFGSFLFILNNCGGTDSGGSPQPVNTCSNQLIAHLKSYCDRTPDWLAEAETSKAEVTIQPDGVVIWHNGEWLNGAWEEGVWQDGIWHSGTWKKGFWYKGTWKNGHWKGAAHEAVWINGTWENGTWQLGIWEGGTWKKGTWMNGVWKRGTWENGTWKKGLWKGQHKGPEFDPANPHQFP